MPKYIICYFNSKKYDGRKKNFKNSPITSDSDSVYITRVIRRYGYVI